MGCTSTHIVGPREKILSYAVPHLSFLCTQGKNSGIIFCLQCFYMHTWHTVSFIKPFALYIFLLFHIGMKRFEESSRVKLSLFNLTAIATLKHKYHDASSTKITSIARSSVVKLLKKTNIPQQKLTKQKALEMISVVYLLAIITFLFKSNIRDEYDMWNLFKVINEEMKLEILISFLFLFS